MDIGAILSTEKRLADAAGKIPETPETWFPLLSAKLKLTWRCNLRCRMCNLWRYPSQRKSETIGYEKTKGLIDELKAAGVRKIHFSGGEVFILPYFEDIVRYTAERGFQINITTNGTLITDEAARTLVDSRVHTVIVSIDSHSRKEHDFIRGRDGAFRDSWNGIAALKKRKTKKGRGPKIAVNTVVTRKTIDGMDLLYDLLVSKGIDSWRLLPVDTELKKIRPTKEQWERLFEKLDNWEHILARLPLDWSSGRSAGKAAAGKFAGIFYGENICFAPWFNIFINADGNAYPCCMGKQDMVPYGNVRERSVGQLLAGERRRDICCTMVTGHHFPVCEQCDDFLEENSVFNSLRI